MEVFIYFFPVFLIFSFPVWSINIRQGSVLFLVNLLFVLVLCKSVVWKHKYIKIINNDGSFSYVFHTFRRFRTLIKEIVKKMFKVT